MLASTSTLQGAPSDLFFCVNTVGFGSIASNSIFRSEGNGTTFPGGICPVIYLDSNISLTSVGTTNNTTTWNID